MPEWTQSPFSLFWRMGTDWKNQTMLHALRKCKECCTAHTHIPLCMNNCISLEKDKPRSYALYRTCFMPHQLCWSDWEMGIAISCTKCYQVAFLSICTVV